MLSGKIVKQNRETYDHRSDQNNNNPTFLKQSHNREPENHQESAKNKQSFQQ
jgi:hypothetical protein